MADYFISRAGIDAERAIWIAEILREEGHEPFFQDEHTPIGRSFYELMEAGASLHTLAIVSDSYFKSDACLHEWRTAFHHGRLTPVLFEDCKLPDAYAHVVYLDLRGKCEEERRNTLLARVRSDLADQPAYVSVAKLPTVNPLLVGRENEIDQLAHAWYDPAVRLVSIVAFGGVGKTALAVNWRNRFKAPGIKRILGWSFYSQGAAEDRQASADPFLDEALRVWFGVKDPPLDSWSRGELLANLIRRERTLLILDGLEPIQYPPGPQYGRLKDSGVVALLKELAAHQPGLCICTSRERLTDLEDYGNAGVVEIDLRKLAPHAGAEYLARLGVQGTQEELEQASKEFDGHALALTLLGTLIVKRRGGDIRKRDTIPDLLIEKKQGGHARRILKQYETIFSGTPELAVLRMLGLFDRPADPGALKILRTQSDDEWADALENLADAKLVEYKDPNGYIDCHPLVREHFAEEYRTADPDGFRTAHSKLYEHYSGQAPHRPNTLEAMQPLFHAVYHGCQAGRHQEACERVYIDRIRRGAVAFLIKKLGAFGTDLSLLANFFESPWSKPVASLAPVDQSWVVAEAGFALRAFGRLAEAIEPMRASVKLGAADDQNWEAASIRHGNLSELHLTLGSIADAIEAARRGVEFADQSGEAFHRMAVRTTLADALHQAGDLPQAAALFEEAEEMQVEWQPEYPLLYSVQGFQYCELLSAEGHRDEVARRATQALGWAISGGLSLLTIALDHLTLGDFDQAVAGLRKAGTLHEVPRGLLARATHYRETGQFEKAQHDLDEVRILATRCGMRLHLTDYHLEQARLFLAQSKPGDARPHYEKAAQLIADTGYHRRDKELDDLRHQLH